MAVLSREYSEHVAAIEALTRSLNYATWERLMISYLKARQVWDVISGEFERSDCLFKCATLGQVDSIANFRCGVRVDSPRYIFKAARFPTWITHVRTHFNLAAFRYSSYAVLVQNSVLGIHFRCRFRRVGNPRLYSSCSLHPILNP